MVLAILLLVLQTGLGHTALQVAGLSRPAPSFVELYFPDARALPPTLPASHRVKISFAVGNVGLTTHTFLWQVSENSGKSRLGLASGRAVVAANETYEVARSLRVACSGTRAQILVSVERPSARITLWLVCPSHS